MKKKIDNFFKITERGSSIKTEVIAGVITFIAMSYILAVNPMILSTTGMDKAGLLTVTALAAMIASIFMGLYANLPYALASGMGLNAYFAFIVCAGMGLTWQEALSLTFYNGIFFFIISVLKIRDKIVAVIPTPLQIGLQCGIGLFIMFMGLQNAGVIVKNPDTLVALGSLSSMKCAMAILGFIATAYLFARNVKGAIIYIIVGVTVLSYFLHDDSGKPLASLPNSFIDLPASISQSFFALDFAYPFRDITKALPVIFTLLMLDMFDSIGTFVALGRRAGLVDSKGRFKNVVKAFIVDSSSTIIGAILGTSTVTSYVESAAGVESGGRTGLTAVVVGLLFGVSLLFSPFILSVPNFATTPALILIGVMMTSGLALLNFKDSAEYVPAIFCMIMIMLSFSITQGFAFGVCIYVLMMIASKRGRQIRVGTWLLFVVMTIFTLWQHT